MKNETILRRAAASSPEAAETLLIVAKALLTGHGDKVDELLKLDQDPDAWRVKLDELRRLVSPSVNGDT